MPRVYSIDTELPDELLDDENYDPYFVAPEEFQYLSPPELGGPAEPVRVAVTPPQTGWIVNVRSAYERLAGERNHVDDWQIKAGAEAARFAAALVALGAVRAYMRYDGGNDEGFAWFVHCVMKDGAQRDADQLAADLEAAGVTPQLKTWGNNSPTRNALDDVVATIWAVSLLGQGFGTGELVLYGAFWVDLENGLVTDDPDPGPVTRNLRLKVQ